MDHLQHIHIMVTIILETLAATAIISPLAGAISWKFNNWLEKRRRNRLAKKALAQFDNLEQDLPGAVTAVRTESDRHDAQASSAVTAAVLSAMGVEGVTISSEAARKAAERTRATRGWVRVRPRSRTELAMCAADEAYYEFGARSVSKANDLVTRKFLRDLLREHKDLRAKDANAIIEIALPFSYVPPLQRATMAGFVDTQAYESRVGKPEIVRK